MPADVKNLKSLIEKEALSRMDFTEELSEEEIYSRIDDALLSHNERKKLSTDEMLRLREEVFYALKKMDILQEFIDDESITEIMINGCDRIFIERDGRVMETGKSFESKQKLEDVIQQIVAGCNRTVNEANPIADARLSSGERVNIVLAPVALNGPIVTIRRFPKEPITMEKLISLGSISREAANFLKKLVEAKYNIFISGGTGSGKTTFLNALSAYIPEDERIITIEDSAELKLLNARNLVRLETRNLNSEGCREITIRDLIKTSLRMRPERIIVGEVRGAEALDMLQAMNTGHDGSLSTGHANSPEDMLSRLETMVLMGMDLPLKAVRAQIASGIDIMVHLSRLRDRSRRVTQISEVMGMENGEIKLKPLYYFEDGGLVRLESLKNTDKWQKVHSEK
ncbi:MAG: CpaF family protein [Lachnospiraceae bacterium]|nr:CpaF family protein [Lachnospiraceae bacterium]